MLGLGFRPVKDLELGLSYSYEEILLLTMPSVF